MKRIILILTITAATFALSSSVQADDAKTAPAACPAQAAAYSTDKAACPADAAKCDKGKACCAADKSGACCQAKKSRLAKRGNPAIKGAQLLVMR